MACPGVAIADRAAVDAEAFYEDHVSSSLPLLIRDGALLALGERWTDDYLAGLAGMQMHDEVRLSENATCDDFPLTKVMGERTSPHSVASFLARYRSTKRSTNLYATNLIIDALRHELPKPAFTSLLDHGCASGWCGGLWLGAGGQRSALHRDFSENVHAVLQGVKRFVLFAPNESRRLHPRPEPSNRLGHASALPDGARTCSAHLQEGGGAGGSSCAAEFARFPEARARALACTVSAGEMLYLPSAWWHEVDSVAAPGGGGDGGGGRSLSLNWWFRAEWPRGTLRHLTAEAERLPRAERAHAYRQLGLDLAQRGRAHDAAALLRRAVELAPADGDAAAALALLQRQGLAR